MRQIKTNIHFRVMVSFLFLISCNQPVTTSDKNDQDSIQVARTGDTTSMPAYDPALDPFTVSGANAKLLHDSLGIKIFEWWIKPGELLPLHIHPDHAMYVLEGGLAEVYFPDIPELTKGKPFEVKKGVGWATGPAKDSARNIGNTTIKMVEIDIYRPAGIEMPAKVDYDSTIDAFTLGGESVQKLKDTLGIRLFISTMKPGDTATLHSHPDHTVYVLDGGEIAVTFKDGTRNIMKLQKGMGFVGGPFADAAKNTGKTTVKLLMTHIYRPRNK